MSRTRIAYIVFSYFVACAATILVCSLPLLPFAILAVAGPLGILFPLGLLGGVAAAALLPSAVAIIYAERHKVRSLRAHLCVGAGVGFVAVALVGLFGVLINRRGELAGFAVAPLVGAIPGMIGGFFYHAMAGHKAGESL